MPDFGYDLPENYYFGGGGDSFATPLAVVLLLLACVLIIGQSRKYAVVSFLLAALLIPLNVSVVLAGLHFNANRILILAGWVRLLVRGERYPDRLNSLDKAILYSGLISSIAYVLVWREFGAVINRLGVLCTTLGSYFLLRSMIRTKEDTVRVIKVLAVIVIFLAPLIWIEHTGGHNFFSLVGAPELSNTRDGKIRAAGPFEHAIIAGTFAVVLVPLFVGLWWYSHNGRLLAAAGILSSCVMMVASASSTPVMSLPAGILALCFWPMRAKMRSVRRGIVVMLVCLQLVMKAPIWFLIDRVSGVLGGSGWHRAMLIDNFVWHFFEWFLIGTKNNVNWGWSMWDVDNAFVGAGLAGGIPGLVLFLYIFIYAFRMIGQARTAAEESTADARLIWAIGAALFANIVGFLGIVYFDQSIVAWYALLAMIQGTTAFYVKKELNEVPISASPELLAGAGWREPAYTER